MKTLEELKQVFESVDGGAEYYDSVLSLIDAEKQTGISSAKKLKADIATYSKYKDALESLGFDGKVEVSTFSDSVKSKLDNTGSQDELTKLKIELQKAVSAQSDFESKLTEERNKRKETLLRESIIQGFRKDGKDIVHVPDIVANGLIRDNKVRLLDDEKTVVFVNGDSEVSFDDGLQGLFKERPDIVKNIQNSGAGSSDGGGNGAKTISQGEYENLSPKARAAFVLDGGSVT